MMNTKAKGQKTEGIVIAELLKRDHIVLIPFGDNERYDIVIDSKGEFKRVQCKTGRIRKGVLLFQTCSSYGHRGNGYKNYRGQIEYFAVYCPDNDKTYIIPIDDVPLTEGRLRLDTPKNYQKKGIRWAGPYEINKFKLS